MIAQHRGTFWRSLHDGGRDRVPRRRGAWANGDACPSRAPKEHGIRVERRIGGETDAPERRRRCFGGWGWADGAWAEWPPRTDKVSYPVDLWSQNIMGDSRYYVDETIGPGPKVRGNRGARSGLLETQGRSGRALSCFRRLRQNAPTRRPIVGYPPVRIGANLRDLAGPRPVDTRLLAPLPILSWQ